MTDVVSALILEKVQPGAILLGGIAASILYGITCLQVYIFFYNNRRDSWLFKLFIYALWILDTLHMAMVIHGLYYYLIENFGRATAMLKPTWSLLAHVYFTIASDFCIRSVFGKRVWTLSRSYILTGGIAATTLACAAAGIVFVTKAFRLGGFAEFHVISVYLYTSLGAGVASDVLVAVSLCAGLMKTRTGFKKADSLIHILMAYAINTSLLTTICSAGCFITYAVWPDRLIFLGIYFCLNKLYFNSLLAALNARQSLREKISGLSTAPTSLTAGAESGSRNQVLLSKEADFYELESTVRATSPVPQIHVSIDRHITVDDHKRGGTSVGVAY